MAKVLMSKSRSVLRLVDTSDDFCVSFNNLNEDPDDIVPFSQKATVISRELWDALGSPQEITVTVQPGNTLQQ